jgi:hypothetical protein
MIAPRIPNRFFEGPFQPYGIDYGHISRIDKIQTQVNSLMNRELKKDLGAYQSYGGDVGARQSPAPDAIVTSPALNTRNPLATGLRCAIPFYEGSGTTAADVSGNGFDATGISSWVYDPDVGWGIDSAATIGAAVSTGCSITTISFLTRIKFQDAYARLGSGQDDILAKSDGTTDSWCALTINPSGAAPFYFLGTTANNGYANLGRAFSGPAKVIQDRLARVTWTYDEALGGSLYVDGDLVDFDPATGALSLASSEGLGFGGDSGDFQFFDLNIWNRALDADEVAAHAADPWGLYRPDERRGQGLAEGLVCYIPFDEGTGDTARDISGNGFDATGISSWVSDPEDGVGIDSEAVIPAGVSTGCTSTTISMLVKIKWADLYARIGPGNALAFTQFLSTSNAWLRFYVEPSGTHPVYVFGVLGGSWNNLGFVDGTTETRTVPLKDNLALVHIVYDESAGSSIWINGGLAVAGVNTGALDDDVATPLLLGDDSGDFQFFNLKIWNRALSAEEVALDAEYGDWGLWFGNGFGTDGTNSGRTVFNPTLNFAL